MDEIVLTEIPHWPPVEPASVDGYIKHVRCDGARFHVLSWSGYRRADGTMESRTHCSESNCIINMECDNERISKQKD